MTRPPSMTGVTEEIETGCGTLYLTINRSEAYNEVFCRLGKSGGCPASWLDGIGRLITFAWNAGAGPEAAIRALTGIQCPSPKLIPGTENDMVLSCVDGIAKILRRVIT